ncbi:hypothetical protein CPB84DRAFT_1775941 [Gymnopilus junonius]|uniref:Uncharacterized protein n=1 Tax=Gymnopilus junonius TaxID=109634 RepID=A0A9P5NRA4_GYMJU|nr:hypothetical protein CPB84DRAFT_1775941 [Gymnopilus junonius]
MKSLAWLSFRWLAWAGSQPKTQACTSLLNMFSPECLTISQLFQNQFKQPIVSSNITLSDYDSARLNSSSDDISKSIQLSHPVSAGYLVVIFFMNLTSGGGGSATNTTGPANLTNTSSGRGSTPPQNLRNNQTGCHFPHVCIAVWLTFLVIGSVITS